MPIKQLVDNSVLNAALDSVQTNIFIADGDFKLVYMNPIAEKTLKSIEMEILRVFGVRVDDFIGESIHKFHRDPDQVERILRNPSALPHEAFFDFGVVHLKTSINGVAGPEGDIIGYIVNWEDVSEKVSSDMEMAKLIIELKNIDNKESL
jgi:methyl-accepting chemotaxis protein